MNDKQINAINYYRNYNKSEKKTFRFIYYLFSQHSVYLLAFTNLICIELFFVFGHAD